MHASSLRWLPLALLGLTIIPLSVHADPAGTNLLPPITDVKLGPRDWTPGAPALDPSQNQADPAAPPPAAADPAKPLTHGWVLFVSGTAQATPMPLDTTLKVDVSAADGTDWHVRLAYDPNVVNGQLYELRFRAKSDIARSVAVASEVGSNNVWPGLYRRVGLTPEWQTFARRFVADKAQDGQNILPEFWIGDKAGSIWLSDVTLTPLPAGSSLLPPVTDAAAWEFAEQRPDVRNMMSPNTLGMPGPGGAAPAAATPPPAPLTKVTTEGDAMKFELDSRPAGYSAVWQGHAALNENAAYTLSFRAKADPPRDLTLQGDVEAPGVAPEGLDGKVKVKRDWQTFSVPFTTKTGSKENHVVPQFVVGGNLGTLWLSDVSLVEGAAATPVPVTTPLPVPAAAAPKPSAGEIALSGKITAVRAAAHSLTLAVVSVTSPDGKTTALTTPRPKTVLVGASLSFANLKPGASVTVIGKDAGSGKPMTARAIVASSP